MSDSNFDVIVVGAGISGLLSALALGKEGKHVLILEKSDVIGGRCRTYEVDNAGFFVDTGVHAITGLNQGPLVKLMEKYFDIVPKFVPHGEYYVRYPGGFAPFPNTIKGFMNFKALPITDRQKITWIVLKAITNASIVKKSGITAYNFIKDAGLSETGMQLVDALSYFSSGLSMKETPAWRILSAGGLLNDDKKNIIDKVKDFFRLAINKSYSEQGYPIGGIQSITDCVLQSFPKNVSIKTGEEAVEIRQVKNSIHVATKKSSFKAETVIYSGEAKKLPDITNMPSDWAASARKLKEGNAMTLWLGLKRPSDAFNYRGGEIWFSKGMSYWAMPVSNHDPHLAPKGKQLIGFCAFLDNRKNAKNCEKQLLQTIYSIAPEIEELIEMKHMQIMPPEKAAISAGVRFPSVVTPIKNLYLVGTDADMRSMGITRASYSVIEMLKAMRSDSTEIRGT